ncbi:MAG: Gfo/Idh/MocA family oxidoreductase [Ruminococcaceae bacterium]|nr:Gfo/Idh/MocA family oxidoreductase [Oscillospiraceae bacterium]
MRKIKVVQIGIGHDHASSILESMLRQPEIFQVCGLVAPETEACDFEEAVTYYRDQFHVPLLSLSEAFDIDDLDAAVIETEEKNLTKYAHLAAEHGLHIHMDKPGGFDKDAFAELVSLVRGKGLVFSLGYMYRYNPYVQEALRKAKSGELGEIYSVEAHMGGEHGKQKREWLQRLPGGMMFFLGCHLVDLIYQLQGSPMEVIPMSTSTGYQGVTSLDYGMALFKYKNGVSFAKACVAEPGGFLRRQLVICGTKGTVEIKPLEINMDTTAPDYHDGDQLTKYRETYATGLWNHQGEEKTTEMYNRYDGMMESFAKYVCGEKENPYSYDYELELYKLILRACGEEV